MTIQQSLSTATLCLLSFGAGWQLRPQPSPSTPAPASVQQPAPVHSSVSPNTAPVSTGPTHDTTASTNPTTTTEDTPSSSLNLSLNSEQLLAQANKHQQPSLRHQKLQELIRHWIEADAKLSPQEQKRLLAQLEAQDHNRQMDSAIPLSQFVAQLSDTQLQQTWKNSYALHPARSQIYAQFLKQDLLTENPADLFDSKNEWNPWENHWYNQQILINWSEQNPQQALSWLTQNTPQFSSNTQEELFAQWAQKDFAELSGEIDSLATPRLQEMAIAALAQNIALQKTEDALAWADSLTTPDQQDWAHEIIYRETPRGIGALINSKNGFPHIQKTIADNGLLAGDLILSALDHTQQHTEFLGKDINTSAQALRGDPGTSVTLQILRRNPESGEYQQQEITIIREQLVLGNK